MVAGAETVAPAATPLRPTTRPAARVGAMTVFAVLLGLWSHLLGIPNDAIQIFVWLWLGIIAWNIDAPWRYHLRFPRDWWLPMVGLVLYFYSRGLTDNYIKVPVHYRMPIDFDRWVAGLFGGHDITPTEYLQRHLCGASCTRDTPPRWYDVVFTTVYASHFVTGLTIAAVLWVRDRAAWVPWMRRYLAINFAALVVYVLYPMAPPWLASKDGFLPPGIDRLTGRGWRDIGLGRFDLVLQGVGNPVAAMPSLHAGITFLVAIYGITRLRSPWRWLLVLYPMLMCVALVYYGEHYVVDVLAGALLAVLVHLGCRLWEHRRAGLTGRRATDRSQAEVTESVASS